ncbi:MAG: methyltransferase domain-containing protein, partial [Chloroflexota bacterium]
MNDHHEEYPETFVKGLEWIWGAGFMSPGGPAEVAAILQGVDLTGKRVLDIGCGIGGIDVLLVEEHGAAHVTGIDVEPPLIERAQALVAQKGLGTQIDIQLVEPGPLPFEDGTFDIVFSKDSIIHIPDKRSIYSDIFRVLKPDGRLAFSDWYGSKMAKTSEFEEWFVVVGLTFDMGTVEEAAALIQEVGFANVDFEDRNAWYAQNILEEISAIEDGDNYAKLEEHLGADWAAQRLKSSSLK